ncbi:hypothetical protein SMICM304S_08258 [Streptomyces microflavus]
MKAKADDPRLLTVTQVCDLDTFRELITDNADAADRGTTKGRETEVNGEPVIPVTRAQGDERLTVYVATEGEPYPVRIAVRGSGEEGTVDFSGFDRPGARADSVGGRDGGCDGAAGPQRQTGSDTGVGRRPSEGVEPRGTPPDWPRWCWSWTVLPSC